MYDRRVGVYAAIFGAFAPIAVWYGQEARMYALFMVLALLGVWAVTRIVKAGSEETVRTQAWWWAVLVAADVGVVLTQWFAALHVVALNLVLLGVIWTRRSTPDGRRMCRRWLIATAVQVVLLAPAFYLAVHQFSGNQERGLGFSNSGLSRGSAIVPKPSVYTLLTNMEWALFGYHSERVTSAVISLWPVAVLVALLMMGRPRRIANRYLAVVVGVPVMGMYAASLLASDSRSLAEVRYFAGIVPALMLLLAAATVAIGRTARSRVIIASVVIAAMVAGIVGQVVETNNPRLYGYREALAEVARRARPGDTLLYAPFFMDVVVAYYSPAMPVVSIERAPLPERLDGRVYVLSGSGFADTGDAAEKAEASLAELRLTHRRVEVFTEPNVKVEVYEGAAS